MNKGGCLIDELADTLDFGGLAGFLIHGNHRSLEKVGQFLGDLKPGGGSRQEAGKHLRLFHADDRVGGTRHADIRQVGGAARQDFLIRRHDVGVASGDRTDPAIQVPPHSPFFTGGLAMHVHHHHFGFPLDFIQGPVGGFEGAVDGVHENPAHQVQHGNGDSFAVIDSQATAGILGRIVVRAQKAGIVPQNLLHFLLRPNVVPRSDHIHPRIDQGFEGIGLDTGSSGQVLAIRDGEINGIVGFHPAETIVHGMAARFPDDVPDDQNVHDMSLDGVVVQEIKQKAVETQPIPEGVVLLGEEVKSFFGKEGL